MTRDRGIGIFTTILGVAVAIMTSQLAESNVVGDVGPAVFPYISAGILIVCGLILTIRKQTKPSKPFLEGKQWLRFLAIIGVIIGYVVLMYLLGFVIPTFAITTLLCMMFGRDEKIPIWKAAIYAAIVTAVIYVMFSIVLSLRLPVGKLF